MPEYRENFWTQVKIGRSIDLAASCPVDEHRKSKIILHYHQVREMAMARAKMNGDEDEVYWEIAWQIFGEVNANWGNLPLV